MFTLFLFLALPSTYLILYFFSFSLSLFLFTRYIRVYTFYRPTHTPSLFLSLFLSPLFFHGFLFNRQSTSRYGLMAMILHSRSTSRGRVIRRQIRSDGRPCRQFRIGMATVVQSTVDNPIKRAAKISVRIPGFARVSNFFRYFCSLFSISLQRVLFSLSLVHAIESFHFLSVVSCRSFLPLSLSSLSLSFFIRESVFRFLRFLVVVIVVALYCLLDIWFVGFLGRVKNARKKLNRWVHASDMLQQLIEWWDAMGDEQLWMPDFPIIKQNG